MKIKSYTSDYQQPIIKKPNKLINKHQSFADLMYKKLKKEDKNA